MAERFWAYASTSLLFALLFSDAEACQCKCKTPSERKAKDMKGKYLEYSGEVMKCLTKVRILISTKTFSLRKKRHFVKQDTARVACMRMHAWQHRSLKGP